jgi:hypothetical protein
MRFADGTRSTGETRLGQVRVLPLAESEGQADFAPEVVRQPDFEQVWTTAHERST